MFGASAFVIIEAIRRIGSPAEVTAGPMLVVGGLGLGINVLVLLMLRAGAGESLNVKGAYLEVVADTAGSVGVLLAGLLVSTTGSPVWDTVVALAIGLFVVIRAISLGRHGSLFWVSTSPLESTPTPSPLICARSTAYRPFTTCTCGP